MATKNKELITKGSTNYETTKIKKKLEEIMDYIPEEFDTFIKCISLLRSGCYSEPAILSLYGLHYNFFTVFIKHNPHCRKTLEKARITAQKRSANVMLEKAMTGAFSLIEGITTTEIKTRRVYSGETLIPVEEIETVKENVPSATMIELVLRKMTPQFSDKLSPITAGKLMIEIIQFIGAKDPNLANAILPYLKKFAMTYSPDATLPEENITPILNGTESIQQDTNQPGV
jgi:hypothetical protein